MCLSQLSLSEVQLGNLIAQPRLEHPAGWICARYKSLLLLLLVSRLSVMVQGRTNIGQLVSQLSLSESYVISWLSPMLNKMRRTIRSLNRPAISQYKHLYTVGKMSVRPKKSLQFLVIGRLQNLYGVALFFGNRKIRDTYTRRDQISHTQSMVAKRGHTNRANVHTLMWKSRLKHSVAEIQSIQ